MIRLEYTEIVGWEAAVRGMRNPMNSWSKSDSLFQLGYRQKEVSIGENDLSLMKRLAKAGTDHRKFMRMIVVYVDVTAPLYWWKEFDTYKVGTVANSCSTMHKIADKEFELDDFSHEHLDTKAIVLLEETIKTLNYYRNIYNNGYCSLEGDKLLDIPSYDKRFWWNMIQLLPSSYNQKRTLSLNYEVLANIYKSRKNHKLDEWVNFCKWIEELPYSEIIIGKM